MIVALLTTSGASAGELVSEAFANLRAHRQRSMLALLGIVIGAASIVAMLTIGHMAQRETLKLFSHLGVDMLEVHAMPAGDATAVLDRRAIESLPSRSALVLASTALAVDRTAVSAGAQSADMGVAAVTHSLPDLVDLRLRRGRFIAAVDDGGLVAVVGATAAAKLSAPGAPLALGSQIRVKGYVLTVIGLVEPVAFTALDPIDFNDAVMTPLTGAGRMLSPGEPDTALLRLRPGADLKTAGDQVTGALSNPTATLQLVSARELIKGMNAQKAIHSRLLTAVGAISLLVGGIGVMNVMLMAVIERRREIGLRAAIGATSRDLQIMFLVEAAALAVIGGVFGLALGLLAALVTAKASGWTFSLPLYVLAVGPGLAGLVGLAFGLFPAIKASRLDPIEALRAE